MPELEPQTRTHHAGDANRADDNLGPDPLAKLHKMSTTAGVGSQDYVAVNTLAVTTAVLGFATAFAFLSAIFLLIALATLVCGLLAIRQINNSNGTQGGRWLAALGIAAAVVFAGIVGWNKLAETRIRQAMARDVNAVLDQFAAHVTAGQFDRAYDLTDPAFQDLITREVFSQVLVLQQSPEYNGRMTSMRGNGIVSPVFSDGRMYAYTQAIMNFEKRREEARTVFIFSIDESGQWRLNRIVDMFQAQLRARGINPQTSSPLKRSR